MPSETELNERERNLWIREAISENPGARGMEKFINATTEQGVWDQARELAERTGSNEGTRDYSTPLYGSGSGAGGHGFGSGQVGGYSPRSPDANRERREYELAKKFNDAPKDNYGQRMGLSKAETDEYTSSRFIGQIKEQMGRWAALTRSDAARFGRG